MWTKGWTKHLLSPGGPSCPGPLLRPCQDSRPGHAAVLMCGLGHFLPLFSSLYNRETSDRTGEGGQTCVVTAQPGPDPPPSYLLGSGAQPGTQRPAPVGAAGAVLPQSHHPQQPLRYASPCHHLRQTPGVGVGPGPGGEAGPPRPAQAQWVAQ